MSQALPRASSLSSSARRAAGQPRAAAWRVTLGPAGDGVDGNRRDALAQGQDHAVQARRHHGVGTGDQRGGLARAADAVGVDQAVSV
jgi:hypothetical protein